jgi:hypothetical protein
VLIITAKVPCPLTWLQNTLREQGGQRKLDMSFIDTLCVVCSFPPIRRSPRAPWLP